MSKDKANNVSQPRVHCTNIVILVTTKNCSLIVQITASIVLRGEGVHCANIVLVTTKNCSLIVHPTASIVHFQDLQVEVEIEQR